MIPAVAVKLIELALAGTVTEGAGIGSSVLLLANPTTVPPFGAAWFSVTVHLVAAPEFRLVGLQVNDDNLTGATKLTVAARETPLGMTAEAAFEYALSAPVSSTAVLT